MTDKINQIKTMLAKAEAEYNSLSIKENGIIVYEKTMRNKELHTKISTLNNVLRILEA